LSALQLFDEAPQETVRRPALHLVAVLYYYGAHYSAFLYHAKKTMWVCVDDSYVQEVDKSHCRVSILYFLNFYSSLTAFITVKRSIWQQC